MSDKPKRPVSAWASLVAAHIKAGGKFPRKGTEDYDKLKKQLDDHKTSKSAPAPAPAAMKAEAAAPVAKKPRAKKSTGVPMPVTDAPIAPVEKVLPAAKKPRTRKVAASKVGVTATDKMDNPAATALEMEVKMDKRVITTEMMAADAVPKKSRASGKNVPNLVHDLSEKKGMAATIPLARISGVQNVRIPFSERLVPTVNPV
jgi:hypothetical protein